MKSLSVKLGVVLVGLAIFDYAEVWGADWKLYDKNDSFSYYYDTQSVSYLSKNMVRVWLRIDVKEKGLIDMGEALGRKLENLRYMVGLIEFNCLEKKNRSLSLTLYDEKGYPIFYDDKSMNWEFIVPESVEDVLYQEVCK